MRTTYHEQLADLTTQLGQMCGLAGEAMQRATHALLDADLAAAERVISDHAALVAMRERVEKEAFALLALQQPVAGDLRAVFSAAQIIADVERMGALAVHVAKIARREYPNHALPDEVRESFAEMSRTAMELSESAQRALVSGDPGQAAGLHEQDDAMDTLHERLFDVIMDRRWPHSAAVGAKTALLGRYYERFADHAVEVGRRVVFMGTGALPAEDEISTY